MVTGCFGISQIDFELEPTRSDFSLSQCPKTPLIAQIPAGQPEVACFSHLEPTLKIMGTCKHVKFMKFYSRVSKNFFQVAVDLTDMADSDIKIRSNSTKFVDKFQG
jgi:hypothetical protein